MNIMKIIKVLLGIDGQRARIHMHYEGEVVSLKKEISNEVTELQEKMDKMNRLLKKNIAADINMAAGGKQK